jgi:hypothetical protein
MGTALGWGASNHGNRTRLGCVQPNTRLFKGSKGHGMCVRGLGEAHLSRMNPLNPDCVVFINRSESTPELTLGGPSRVTTTWHVVRGGDGDDVNACW